jgi:two-component system nitrogen regulation sensor histidine kinase NtrY
VNEFSKFARMPKSNPQLGDLNSVVADAAAIYKEAHPDIDFQIGLDNSLPEFALDKEQLKRVLVNLIDNAVHSITLSFKEDSESGMEAQNAAKRALRSVTSLWNTAAREAKSGIIKISTEFDAGLGIALLTVSDNGRGIPDNLRKRLFEPYFSGTEGGTGLGLAIARTIVSDHNGFIRLRDNQPQGAVFVVELPITREALRRTA